MGWGFSNPFKGNIFNNVIAEIGRASTDVYKEFDRGLTNVDKEVAQPLGKFFYDTFNASVWDTRTRSAQPAAEPEEEEEEEEEIVVGAQPMPQSLDKDPFISNVYTAAKAMSSSEGRQRVRQTTSGVTSSGISGLGG